MNRQYLFFPLALLFVACSNAEVDVNAGVESGALSETHEGEQLLVSITEISVHVANTNEPDDPCDNPEAEEDCNNSFIPIFEGEERINLFASSELSALVEGANIPAGKITQIRLLLSDATWLNGDLELPVSCSSCDESGLKLVTSGDLELQPGDKLSLDLFFDSELSLRLSANGASLDPVIRMNAKIAGQ